MNILITGSRRLTNVDVVFSTLRKELKEGDAVIHGGASGADSIASAYCNENNIACTIMRPIYPSKGDYYLHRNAEMIGMCDRVIAFWDGESRGTKFTINYARQRKLDVKVIKTTNNALNSGKESDKDGN